MNSLILDHSNRNTGNHLCPFSQHLKIYISGVLSLILVVKQLSIKEI